MRLYRTAKGRWVGTQADARASGKGWSQVEVPTDKAGLMEFLTGLTSNGEGRSYACQVGRADAERGMTANPFASQELRDDWERCHAEAVELGLGKRPSFKSIGPLPRNAPRRARKAAPKKEKVCTTARCRKNRNRPKGMLG